MNMLLGGSKLTTQEGSKSSQHLSGFIDCKARDWVMATRTAEA